MTTWLGDASARDLIIDNVVSTLEAITVADGYEVDVVEVTRDIDDVEELIVNKLSLSGTPIHQIVAGKETVEQVGSSGLMQATLSVVDWLVVAGVDLERILRDTKRVMVVDRRRGTHPTSGKSLALNTRLESIETAEGIYHPFELARVEWEIDYTYIETAP